MRLRDDRAVRAMGGVRWLTRASDARTKVRTR
jgi:hypothetical protein